MEKKILTAALDPQCRCECSNCRDDQHFLCNGKKCEIGAAVRLGASRRRPSSR